MKGVGGPLSAIPFLKKSPNIVFPRDFVETFFFFFSAEHPRQVVLCANPPFKVVLVSCAPGEFLETSPSPPEVLLY